MRQGKKGDETQKHSNRPYRKTTDETMQERRQNMKNYQNIHTENGLKKILFP